MVCWPTPDPFFIFVLISGSFCSPSLSGISWCGEFPRVQIWDAWLRKFLLSFLNTNLRPFHSSRFLTQTNTFFRQIFLVSVGRESKRRPSCMKQASTYDAGLYVFSTGGNSFFWSLDWVFTKVKIHFLEVFSRSLDWGKFFFLYVFLTGSSLV